jgi:hypothetical protein
MKLYCPKGHQVGEINLFDRSYYNLETDPTEKIQALQLKAVCPECQRTVVIGMGPAPITQDIEEISKLED